MTEITIGAAVWIAVGVLVFGALIGAFVCWLFMRNRQQAGPREEIAGLQGQLKASGDAEDFLNEAKSTIEEKANQIISEVKTSNNDTISAVDRSISLLTESNRRVGSWGERTLKNVAEAAGMSENCDFDVQVRTDSGKVIDMLINMSDGLKIIVDAKATLNAFKEAKKAELESGSEEADAIREKHAKALRDQVKDLEKKKYPDDVKESLDFVIMFVPGDQFLSAALRADSELIDFAAEKRIYIVTPVSLMAMLRAVDFGWRQKHYADKAKEIQEAGDLMHRRMMKFIEHYQKVGRGLESTVKAFNASIGSFDKNLVSQARKISQLNPADEDALSSPDTIDTLPRKSRYSGEDE